ncbi:MAG: Gfo/Idh/MocA family oxidoreductase [Actinobacteria bacterium]|nr:Gfo/Idh/MocA family oxidoreductase [Actinomycetota bacterium]
MDKIRAGIVGAGFVGPLHIENLRRIGIAEVKAIAEMNQEKADIMAEKLGVEKAYGDWRKLVADPGIDVVHITAPNKLHFPIAKECIEAGKHVICEKPLTMDTKEAKLLVGMAKAKRVVNATTFNMAFYPMVRHAKEMVSRGEAGRVFLAHGRYLQDWLSKDSDYNWRVEAQFSGKSRVVGDICSHWMHMMQMVLGKRIGSVYADLTTFIPTRKKPLTEIPTHSERELQPGEYEELKVDTEDHATIMFNFEGGIKGVLIAAQVCPGRKQFIEWEINASGKSLGWNGEEPNVLWIGERSSGNTVLIKDPNVLYKGAREYAHYSVGLAEGYPDTWKNLLMAVYKYIQDYNPDKPAEPVFPTFEDGYRIQVLIDAVLESAEKNRWVEVSY